MIRHPCRLYPHLLVSVVDVLTPEVTHSNDTRLTCLHFFTSTLVPLGCMYLTPAEIVVRVSSRRLQGSARVIGDDERHGLLNYFVYYPYPSAADGAGEKELQREGDEKTEKGRMGGAGGEENPSLSTFPATTPSPPAAASAITDDIDLEVRRCFFRGAEWGWHGGAEEPWRIFFNSALFAVFVLVTYCAQVRCL